jgi:hypothetical protein
MLSLLNRGPREYTARRRVLSKVCIHSIIDLQNRALHKGDIMRSHSLLSLSHIEPPIIVIVLLEHLLAAAPPSGVVRPSTRSP